MYEVVCCICGSVKTTNHKPKKPKSYCSPECVHKSLMNRVEITCVVCGTKKMVVASRAKKGVKYCSSECQAKRPPLVPKKHIHCQRPGCRNAIWHYKPIIKDGHVKNQYYPDKKYCCRMCAGSNKSAETIEKQRTALLKTYQQKKEENLSPPVDNISYTYQNEFATPEDAYD